MNESVFFKVVVYLLIIILTVVTEVSVTNLISHFIENEKTHDNEEEIHQKEISNGIATISYPKEDKNRTIFDFTKIESNVFSISEDVTSTATEFKNISTPKKSHGIFAENRTKYYPSSGLRLAIEEAGRRAFNKKARKRSIVIDEIFFAGIFMIIIYSGVIISTFLRNVSLNQRFPVGIQAPLLLYGILTGLIFRSVAFSYTDAKFFEFQNYVLVYLVVPLMLYRACVTSNIYEFKRNFVGSLIISVPGLLTNAIIVGITMRYLMEMNWSFVTYTFFGTCCVFVHPKQIIDIMKKLDSKSQQLAFQLEGELIMGTVFVYVLYMIWFRGHLVAMSALEVFLTMLRYLSGILIGFVAGFVNCYFFWIFSTNVIDMFLFVTVFPLLVFFICYLLNANPIVAISICGLMLVSGKIVLNKRSETVIKHYWIFFTTLIDSTVLTGMGVFVAWSYVWYSDLIDYVYIVLMYCITYFARFLTFSLLSPITSRLGFQMDARFKILAVCGGVPSLINISYTLLPSSIADIEKVRPIILFYVTGMIMISLSLNTISLPYLISFLKLDVVSLSRESDLKSCLRFLRSLKYKELQFMKLESLMGETDWPLVRKLSNLESPFSKEICIQDEEEDQSVVFCPECHNKFRIPSNDVEYPNQRAATNLRMLKAREAMQFQMFSKDLLSSKSFATLNEILKEAYNHPNNCQKSDNLVKKFDLELICAKTCRKGFQTWSTFISKKNQIRPPNYYWRRLCYHLMQNKVFHIITVCVIILNMVLILTEGCINPKPSSDLKYVFTFFDVVFLTFYTSEWLINIAGRARIAFWRNGLKEYLRSPFNIFDFFILITVWTSFIIETSCYMHSLTEIFLYDHRLWFTVFKSVRILRLIRYMKHTQEILTKTMQYYQSQRLLSAYDVAKDFSIQERRMLHILPTISHNYTICCEIGKDIEHTLGEVTRELYNVQMNYSWISTTVKTRYAAKLVINSMKDTVDHLLVAGWIDTNEHHSLISILNTMMEKVNRKRRIDATSRENIFENVSWIQGHPDTKNALFEKAEMRIFEAGKCIFQEGDKSNGIYIILAGVCDISYMPQEEKLSRLYSYGELPVVDNLLFGNFEKPINSYVTSGMTIGELSFLTKRPYSSNVTTESPCEAYFLSSEVLHKVMKVDSDPDNGLECRIWKNVSKNMTMGLLIRLAKNNFDENLLDDRFLRRSYIPSIDHAERLKVSDFVKDVVLIEGVIEDAVTEKRYVGPCRIPRKIENITFPENQVKAKLLFMPKEEIDDKEISFQKMKGQKTSFYSFY